MHKFYTALELAGSLWWVGKFLAYMPNGRVGYETATATQSEKSVKLSRLVISDKAVSVWTVRQQNSYIASETVMILKEIKYGR